MSLRYELILRVQRNNRNMKCLCILPLVLAPNVLNSHDWMLLSLGRNARTYKPSIVWTSGRPVFETKTSIWGSALNRTSGTLWNWSLSIYVDHEQTLGTRRKNRKTKKSLTKFFLLYEKIFLLPLDGMLVHRKSFARNLLGLFQQFSRIHLYSWVERDTARHSEAQCPQQGIEPGPLAPGTSALTMSPPSL